MSDVFTSSDSLRSARPLKYARCVHLPNPITLARGETLPNVTIAYETYGTLNPARTNAILICHAISGDSHVAQHNPQDDPGWWDLLVGPGKVIDTNRYFVLCSNILGGCRGTTGPNSVNPATGKPFGPDFPVITVQDMVDVQRMLLDHLGIEKLLAVVGGSLGGHQALCWATRYPHRVHTAVTLATSPHLTSQALAFDVVARNAILRDPHFCNGQYYDQPHRPDVGLAIARMLGHITYLSPQAMRAKFDNNKLEPHDVATEFEKKFSVGSYLAYQGHKFVERFDANSYITLSMAMDLFDLGRTRDELTANLVQSSCTWLVLSFTSDWLFPAFQSRQIVDALIAAGKRFSYCNVQSDCGHDAFLLPDNLPIYGEMIRAFLQHAAGDGAAAHQTLHDQSNNDSPTSIFQPQRLDYDGILQLIEPSASVLDVGCGCGGLLASLAENGHPKLVGVELDESAILSCIRRGLDVIQADVEQGLPDFADQQFDYVVLSQTLQSIVRTDAVVNEILRIGKRGIVSFPNFAYHKIRRMLFEQGRSPGSDQGLLHFPWYETPNRRFLSILDWQEFCAAKNIRIHQAIYLDTEAGQTITDDPNANADTAIFVISR
jgi:homoserine O-acetyltransferase